MTWLRPLVLIALVASVANARPRYYAVHIDHLAPGKAKQFEDARRAWVGVLAKHSTTDGRGWLLQLDPSTFYTLRPFDSFAQLDHRRELVTRALASVPAADAKEYDRLCDDALAPPHKSELWQVDEALSYTPATAAPTEETAGYAVVVFEELDPTPAGEAYEQAWKPVVAALATAGHPITRLAFDSLYGDGRRITVWLARSKEDFDRAPTVEATAARILGREKSDALFKSIKGSVLKTERFETRPRRDLSSRPL